MDLSLTSFWSVSTCTLCPQCHTEREEETGRAISSQATGHSAGGELPGCPRLSALPCRGGSGPACSLHGPPRWLQPCEELTRGHSLLGVSKVLPNQTWVRSPVRSKADLLTPGCGGGKRSVYCRRQARSPGS